MNPLKSMDGIVKIIQITDTHFFADDNLEMYGVKPNIKFREVMSRMINEDLHDADMILLTGDMSQDETAESYQKIANHFCNFDIPIYWIPGNHDHNENMEAVFQSTRNFYRVESLSLTDWHLIFLNTKINGREDGCLTQAELDMLRREITATLSCKKIAIIMHHHPFPVNTPLIDNYILKNRQDFWNIVNGSGVELIICGHVHGDYSIKYHNMMIETSPATCIQWEKNTTDLKTLLKIGYKIYHLDQSGYKAITKIW